MILSFSCDDTKKLFDGVRVARWVNIAAPAMRKLAMLDAAMVVADLRNPPGSRLEALTGDRQCQFSVRVNEQWRVCFRWTDGGAVDVRIVDYHP